MNDNDNKDEHAGEVRNDGGLFTGAALVGGTKLVYDIGKDIYSRFKPEKKLFLQLLNSQYLNKHHVITARFASAHIHSIHIESVYIKGGSPRDIQGFRIYPSDGLGFGTEALDSEERVVQYPFLLQPSGTLDIHIKIPEMTETKVIKEGGTDLICTFSLIDKLGDLESTSSPVRLRWA